MATDGRSLINYLPMFMQDFMELRQIMNADQTEIDTAWTKINEVQDYGFVSYASEAGIERWEEMLSISPKATDTLEERRFRILTQLQTATPYTMLKLEEKLSTLCGSDGYSIDLDANNYYIEIKLALANKNMLDEVQKILTEMIPANMQTHIQIMYNTYGMLTEYTHGDLASYTHKAIREEVFED